jgi:hypothetical protein
MVLDSVVVYLEMNLILLDRDCGDRREGSTVPGGVMESGFAGTTMFLRTALDRVTKVTQVWCTWFVQDSFKMLE